ncbi:MAG: hypothetical protein R3195_04925 [Gemmatimonadota bacterium]|nr:hypothetical protein [Gemmatimonadota bacterium]
MGNEWLTSGASRRGIFDERKRWPAVRASAAALAAAGIFLGCARDETVTGPPPNASFDPIDVANSIFSLRYAPDNIAIVHVGTITDELGLTTPGFSAAPRRYERGEVERGKIARSFAPGTLRDLVARRTLRLSVGASAVPLFPANFLGETFVWDDVIDGYVLAPGPSDAPPDGVRFVMYRLETSSRLPSFPLTPFGFVDLIDESDAVSTKLRVVAFDTAEGSLPLADYIIDGAFAAVTTGVVVNFLSNGFVIDHNGRFDFELDETLDFDDIAGLTIATLDHRVVSDEGTVTRLRVNGEVANDGSFADLDFLFDIDGSAGSSTVDLRVVDSFQDGVISHFGRDEVIVGGTVALPEYAWVGGGSFTPSEIAALDEILFGIDDVLILADEVFRPLGELFGVR